MKKAMMPVNNLFLFSFFIDKDEMLFHRTKSLNNDQTSIAVPPFTNALSFFILEIINLQYP